MTFVYKNSDVINYVYICAYYPVVVLRCAAAGVRHRRCSRPDLPLRAARYTAQRTTHNRTTVQE